MDQAVIVSCKRAYQRKYLDEVYCVIDDDDGEVDRRGEKIKKISRTITSKGSYLI